MKWTKETLSEWIYETETEEDKKYREELVGEITSHMEVTKMTNWKFVSLEEFINNNYWENPEDAIGDIRKFITQSHCPHNNSITHTNGSVECLRCHKLLEEK